MLWNLFYWINVIRLETFSICNISGHVMFLILQFLAVVYDTFSGFEKKKLRKLFFHKREGCRLAFKLLTTKKVCQSRSWNEPRHDKTNIMGLRPTWIQTRLRMRIGAVWSGSMLFAYNSLTSRETDREQHGFWSDCGDAQADLDPCWSQTHYVGFVMTWLKCSPFFFQTN
jgi:hypothetical protein